MSLKGMKKLKRRLNKELKDVSDKRVEIGLTKWGFLIGARADQYTPIDTSALLNSRQNRVGKTGDGWRLAVSYNQAYAAPLHERTNWSPKPPGTPGKRTGGYNPQATHHYLEKGADEVYAMGVKVFNEAIA